MPDPELSQPRRILFLDDMEERHKSFKQRMIGSQNNFAYVYTAADAIKMLDEYYFDQAFLDHDLSHDDIMCQPGDKNATVPTGMTVVDHILTMEKPPGSVIIHSCNGPAAEEMDRRLRRHPINQRNPTLLGTHMNVMQIPFPELLRRIA